MLSQKEKELLRLIDSRKEQIVERLRMLIRYPTVTPGLGCRAEGRAYSDYQRDIGKTLEGMGFTLDSWQIDASKLETFRGSGIDPDRDLSNMPVLVGRKVAPKGAKGGRSFLLNGHYDVVPPGELDAWNHDPFQADRDQNRVYGRGASDMKGGIAAMLSALELIDEMGVELEGDLLFESVPDEEGSTMGTLACCQKGYRADAALIPEPTDMNIQLALRGGVSGKATVYGRSGHADRTQPHFSEGGAVNAITKSMKVLRAMEELNEEWRLRPDKRHQYLDPDIVIPTLIHGGEWFVMYPEKVEIDFTTDFIPGTKNLWGELEEKIQAVAAADPWMKIKPPKLEQTDTLLYGAEVDEREPIVSMAEEIMRQLGRPAKLTGSGGLTDAVHLINYAKVPTISIGPRSSTAHMNDEHIDIEELILLTKIVSLLLLRWCGHR
jgi:acetylornithine deacetylase